MTALLVALALQEITKEHFPVGKGTRWTYQAGEEEVVTTSKGTEKVGDVECVKLTSDNGPSTASEWFQVDAAGVTLRKLEQWRNERLAESAPQPPILRLKFGAKKGESWEWKGEAGAGGQRATYTHAGEEAIEVPAGKYTCVKIKVDAESPQGKYTVERWFAKEVGLVKQVIAMGERTATTELKAFEKAK
jgi:hypothetical protein